MNSEIKTERRIKPFIFDLYGIIFRYNITIKRNELIDPRGRSVGWLNLEQKNFIAKYGIKV